MEKLVVLTKAKSQPVKSIKLKTSLKFLYYRRNVQIWL